MTEPNEEIVRRDFELRGYFVRSRVAYRVLNGYSDIGLVEIHRDPEQMPIAVEVKG